MQNMPGPTNTSRATDTPWWGKMVIYWLDDQIAITFYSNLPPTTSKQDIIASLCLDKLDATLTTWGYKLSPFQQQDVYHVKQDNEATSQTDDQKDGDLNSPFGKYVFQHPSGYGSLVKCFFHVEQSNAYGMYGVPIIRNMGSMYDGTGMGATSNTVSACVNLINNNRTALKQAANVAIVAASPNWLSGGTPLTWCGTHGCPLPPVPVQDSAPSWHVTLRDLSPEMQKRTGDKVTVFVLDTSPDPEQIKSAASRAGEKNALLQTISTQMDGAEPKFVVKNPQLSLPAILGPDSADQPMTGRDIFGRLVGYDVTDHGLFVAGLIRDIAPGAKIECVRVLNNLGVGSYGVIVEALEEIHNRMSPLDPTTGKQGDLYNQPVVINMSLVMLLHQEEMVPWWSNGSVPGGVQVTDDTLPLSHSLHGVIQSLTALGAVVVAAAGNDSDNHQLIPPDHPEADITYRTPMKPRYPAAFPEVISVGAVDRTEHASVYSNDPVGVGSMQHNGIATYGGGFPKPVFPPHAPCVPPRVAGSAFDPDCMTGVDMSKLDALVGLYSAQDYPALSADDNPQVYKAPNDNGWTYWSGTSFATPIISAVAARLLEDLVAQNLPSSLWHPEVMRAFTTASGQKERLTGGEMLPLQPEFSMDANINVGLLRAAQKSSDQQ